VAYRRRGQASVDREPSAERFARDALRLKPEIVRSRWMAMTFRG
jgi:hypothetical protein